MTYTEAKKQIKKVGYANVSGDAAILADCECLDDFFKLRAMSSGMAKKIYLWAIRHGTDVREVLRFAHKEDDNKWIVWSAIFDDEKPKFL